ncbi:Protein IQ-DOMAIN 1 [Rhynchospora pubera]|uniref:Protein IQ-DOMAIN 1 n=1 Tax=Rhynchospora pubera TaxID=906938 RepID=A0AAV8E010_9POAL|nr:Protein IQ-DOMAIN 1 [Rhynchospora pubera]
MGKKGKWFGAVKKVFSPESKKSKKKSEVQTQLESDPSPSTPLENTSVNTATASAPVRQIEEIQVTESVIEEGKNVVSAGPSVPPATAKAAPEIVKATPVLPARFAGKSREEIAAIKIQTAFRGYMARRALRALRGLVRLKSLIDGNSVKRQAASTLRCMQTLARVQSQIRTRRLRMTEENQALQRQLLLKKELESLRMGEEWDDSTQSKEQIEASIVSKQEATIRRERAMAYAFSHQWKNNSRTANPMFIDPSNPQWGWSWLERWMAAKPWENRGTDKDQKDTNSVKSGATATVAPISVLGEGEITKSYARREITNNSSPNKPSPTTPKPLRPSPIKNKPGTPKNGRSPGTQDDDVKSVMSVRSELPRRHSLAGSVVVRDDESLPGSPTVPSYMAPTQSARAKSRFQTPSPGDDKVETPEKGSSTGLVKKRLSFATGDKSSVPSSPMVMRRHSGPPKMEVAVAVGNGN